MWPMFNMTPAPARSASASAVSASDLSAEILRRFPAAAEALQAIAHHPRSLARPVATWRPPTKTLPRFNGGPQLTAAITRRRVGPRARARIQGYGQSQVPAYLIEVRVTDAAGVPVDARLAEAWVRTMVPAESAGSIHELSGGRSVSYVWLVDGHFNPIESPSSMFQGLTAA